MATTATYGDKFRPLVRHTLRALEDGGGKGGSARSTLQTRASLVFVAKVNGFIKGMIEKGRLEGDGGTLGSCAAWKADSWFKGQVAQRLRHLKTCPPSPFLTSAMSAWALQGCAMACRKTLPPTGRQSASL